MSKHINRNIASKLMCANELSINTLCSKPLLHLYSDKEMVIEGANNLDYYDDSNVRISLEKLTLTINGRNLYIKCLANKNLSISGVIENINFEHYKK